METIYSREIKLSAKTFLSKHLDDIFIDAIRDAFYEARLTHPMIGFKHKDVEEYLQQLKTK